MMEANPPRGEPMTESFDWLDAALAGARRRAHTVDGPATDPAPPAPAPAALPARPGPAAPAGRLIPAGPMSADPPTADLIRDALRRLRR